eukprot:scaffold101398_cov26-Attheya_sp.AAC.1
MGVSKDDIDVVNRWKLVECAKGTRPNRPMRHHYAELSMLVKPFLRYTKAISTGSCRSGYTNGGCVYFLDQGMLRHIVGEGVSALITLLFLHVLPDHRIPIYSLIRYGSASLGSLKLHADSTIPPFYGTLAQARLSGLGGKKDLDVLGYSYVCPQQGPT